jgi:hypothetical protein
VELIAVKLPVVKLIVVKVISVIRYITPKDMLAERQQAIRSERDRRLAAAGQQRQVPSPASGVTDEAA